MYHRSATTTVARAVQVIVGPRACHPMSSVPVSAAVGLGLNPASSASSLNMAVMIASGTSTRWWKRSRRSCCCDQQTGDEQRQSFERHTHARRFQKQADLLVCGEDKESYHDVSSHAGALNCRFGRIIRRFIASSLR